MKKNIIVVLSCFFCLSFLGFDNSSSPTNEIPYPTGYRYWVHIKTGLIGPGNPNFQTSGGYHHIYANAKAMEGYSTGYFPDGSMLVFDVLDTKEQNGNIQESNRKHIDVMLKDSLKYASTGGWGYEEFNGDSYTQRILTPTAKTQCFNCHAKINDFVFSEFRK